jgi:hypothetical protein
MLDGTPAEGRTTVRYPFPLLDEGYRSSMPMNRISRIVVLGLLLWGMLAPVWSQTIPIFPKEDILLVGGDFRLRSIYSNIAGANDEGGGESGGFPDAEDDTKSLLDTRLRLYWDFRPNELLRIHYRMEIGDIVFGGSADDGSDVSGNLLPVIGPGSGGGVGADGVNVETKNIFLEFYLPFWPSIRFRGGIFGYGDRFDFNILADDFAGLQLLYDKADISAHFVYLKFLEGDTRTNADDSDWFGIDGQLRLNASTTIGSSFHFWVDKGNRGMLADDPFQWWLGLELTSLIGPVQANGYFIYNQGEGFFGRRSGKNQGVNVSLGGDMPFGKATLGLQLQYISGEKGSKIDIETGSKRDETISSWVSYYNNMYQGPSIISRGPLIDVGDGFNSKWGTGNGFFNGDYNGRLLLIARGAYPLLPNLTLHLVGAYDRAAADNANGDSARGFEVDFWAQWNIQPKLWLRFGIGYYITGDWWENNSDATFDGRSPGASNPDNLWQFGTRLQYDFG